MYALLIQFDIEPEHRDAYVAAISGHARRARENEPGTVRFDVIEDEGDPNRIFIYEIYTDRAALDAHNGGASIAQFREEAKGLSARFTRLGRGETAYPPNDDAAYWHK